MIDMVYFLLKEEKRLDAIKEIAYNLWKEAGEPAGADDFFWKKAELLINNLE